MRVLLTLLTLIPFTATAGMLGLDSKVEGDYNLETNKSTLTGEIGKTISAFGLSVTGDIDFDITEFEYTGVDFKSAYSLGDTYSMEIFAKSGLDTNWEMEDIVVGFSAKF